ncbi:MAG TPA: hypothetical protein VF307_08360 [Candidatus Nanopelagicaceae bacterium]
MSDRTQVHRAPHKQVSDPEVARDIVARAIVAFPLTEYSVKVSNGQPDDPESDVDSQVWAGVHQDLATAVKR